MTDRQELLVKLLLAVTSLLLTCLAFELALRFVLLRNLNPFLPDEEIGYRLKTSFEGAYPRVAVRTDERGRRIPLDANRPTPTGDLVFIGDSVTFGFGVLAEETFPYLFGELRDRPEDVTNVAVPGYNLQQSLVLLREELASAEPEMVVYGLSINDIYGAADFVTFEDIDPHRNRTEGGGILSRSLLVAFLQRRLARIGAAFDMVEVAGGDPVHFRDLEAELDDDDLDAFRRQWSQLEGVAASAEVPFYVMVFPYRGQVEDPTSPRALQEFASSLCADGPLVCLDPLPDLVNAEGALFNGESSYHFNARGHELIARFLHRHLPALDS